MGLAICLRIITAHDGTIQAASRPGGGTSIIVRLPRARESAQETVRELRKEDSCL
jgi:signal transduction histidine kinase